MLKIGKSKILAAAALLIVTVFALAGCKSAKEEKSAIINEYEQKIAKLTHDYQPDRILIPATCQSEGVQAFVCKDCGDEILKAIPRGEHTPSAVYSFDCNEHWKVCGTCGSVIGREAHTVGEDGICTICNNRADSSQELAFARNADGTYTVTGIGSCTGSEIVIPKTYNGKAVVTIGSAAFEGCNSLESVTIPDGVTRISSSAFEDCGSLTSVTIPNSVTSVGSNAFKGCHIENATIPSNVIGSIPKQNFINVVITGGDSIEAYAFSGCGKLTSITIPNSVMSIGYYAFYNCNSLSSITIPNNVTSIGDHTFEGCSSLTSIAIPDSVTSIGYKAFKGCGSLSSITIPDSVTSIGDLTEPGYAILISISGPTNIGNFLFEGCSSLKSIIVAQGNPKYHSAGNCLIETETGMLLSGCQSSVIPTDGSVKSISNYAFSGCSSLASVTIPDSVTSIGKEAFFDCSSLASVTIPDSVTSIGGYAFAGCDNLTSAVFENPNGWHRSSASGWSFSLVDENISGLSDASTAAMYLRDTYSDCNWTRN